MSVINNLVGALPLKLRTIHTGEISKPLEVNLIPKSVQSIRCCFVASLLTQYLVVKHSDVKTYVLIPYNHLFENVFALGSYFF